MGEDQIYAWAEGMYTRLYTQISPTQQERFNTAYNMESGVLDAFMDTLQPGLPTVAEMPEEKAMQYLEWVFQIFMAGWGQGIAWVQAQRSLS